MYVCIQVSSECLPSSYGTTPRAAVLGLQMEITRHPKVPGIQVPAKHYNVYSGPRAIRVDIGEFWVV